MMNAIATFVGTADVRDLSAIIIGVLALTAIFAWMALRFIRTLENPRKVRRRLFLLGMAYIFAAIYVITEVANGREPRFSLLGLPIGLFFAWYYLRAASKIQPPSN
jgi:hypothetical protein